MNLSKNTISREISIFIDKVDNFDLFFITYDENIERQNESPEIQYNYGFDANITQLLLQYKLETDIKEYIEFISTVLNELKKTSHQLHDRIKYWENSNKCDKSEFEIVEKYYKTYQCTISLLIFVFEFLCADIGNDSSIQTKISQQTETETKQEQPTFKNNFDNVSTVEIHKHFKAGLVEKGYLTEQELNEYLKAAFELKKIPETLFKIKDAPTKATIEAVFYTYYKNVAGKVHRKQPQYAALLGNYFEGYRTETVSSNFSKSIY